MTCPGTQTDEDRRLFSSWKAGQGEDWPPVLLGGWMIEWIINIRCCPLLVEPSIVIVEPHSALSLIEVWVISGGNLQHNQWEIKYWCHRAIRETSGVAHFLPLLLGIFICSQAGMNSCKSPGPSYGYRLLRCLGLVFERWSMCSLI